MSQILDDNLTIVMTNYRAYLCGGPQGKGTSKQELKLKRALAFGDKKKIAEALCEMPRAEDICTQIPHFKGGEYSVPEKKIESSDWL